jgi:hypothetical protein
VFERIGDAEMQYVLYMAIDSELMSTDVDLRSIVKPFDEKLELGDRYRHLYSEKACRTPTRDILRIIHSHI